MSEEWDRLKSSLGASARYGLPHGVRTSEASADTITKDIQLLVEKGEQPNSVLENVNANRKAKTAARASAEFSVVRVRNNLCLTMGMDAGRAAAIPLPGIEFPQLTEEQPRELMASIAVLNQRALKRRADWKALGFQEEADEILLTAARLNQRPQLDLSVSLTTKGQRRGNRLDDFGGAFTHDNADPEHFVGVQFWYPFGNNSAGGYYRQALRTKEITSLQKQELTQSILTSLHTALAQLDSGVAELQSSLASETSYLEAVRLSTIRFRAGMATLLDIIDTEDRLAEARARTISARANVAKAIVDLRFVTGTLLEIDEAGSVMEATLDNFVSLPGL